MNPATGQEGPSYPESTPAEVRQALQSAVEAFLAWRRTEFAERARHLRAAASVLRQNHDVYARLMAQEMGKPISQGRAEIQKCAAACDYFAENAERFLTPEAIPTQATRSFVTFEPLGVILAIMPWNFPFWQVFRCAAPALMAGNALILKHASNVPGCALAIADVFHQAGLPAGLFRSVLIDSRAVGGLIESPVIQAVSLTGSVSAGRAIAAAAGASLKKVVLELGGSDAYVVLEDCDLEQAVQTCVTARLINSGQSCIAAKRFIVHQSIIQPFQKRFVALMAEAKLGDPLSPETTVGPLARQDLRQQLHDQVERSIAQGAKLLLGGKIPSGPGWFYPPTVLTGVRPGMACYQEETFGPVAAMIRADSESEALRLANDTTFGLGAAVFTEDRERGEYLAAKELQAGACFVNDYVRSDPRLPFGGIKDSGYGRELAAFGIREFVNVKTVWIR